MARTKRVRRYKRIGRWSSNLQEIPNQSILTPKDQTFYYTYTICKNPVQSMNSVSQPFTVKNVELSFYIDSAAQGSNSYMDIDDICVYIMYVPQGMGLTVDFNKEHPEWIMAWKLLGNPSTSNPQQYQPYKVKSRLSRRLNTGDSIVIFVKGTNTNTQYDNMGFHLHGIVRWWTKAN